MLFPAQVLVCAGLCGALWLLCGIVGTAILPTRETTSAELEEPSPWNQFGIGACVGLATLLALGGLGIVLRIPIWVSVGGFVVAAAALLVRQVRQGRVSRSIVTIGGLGLVALVVLAAVAFLESAAGLRLPANSCDDLRAYIPMASRLIDTGGLDDPWSIRRLLNFGGITYLQALPVAGLGGIGVGIVECLVASVFLGGVFVANPFRNKWIRAAGILVVLAIPVLWVPRANSAAVFITVPFFVATFAAAIATGSSLRAGRFPDAVRWAIAGGLACAAIASLRVTLVPTAGLAFLLGVLATSGVPLRSRARALGAFLASGAVAFAPWSIAMWQSSGTPLFPLLPGNANLAGPSNHDPALNTAGDFIEHAADMARTNNYIWVALAVLVLAIAAWRILPDPRSVIIFAFVVALSMPATAALISLAPEWDYARYVGPMAEGLAIFFLYEMLRGADVVTVGAARPRLAWCALLFIPLAVVLVACFRPIKPYGYLSTGFSLVNHSFTDEARIAQRKNVTGYPSERDYRKALSATPDPSRTILAVDRPGLIDFSKWDVPTMDLPGWAAPDGHFPFFSGPDAKIAALRHAGYDTLIVTMPRADACLSVVTAIHADDLGTPEITIFWRYFRDWVDDIHKIWYEKPQSVTEYGRVLSIDLRRAGR